MGDRSQNLKGEDCVISYRNIIGGVLQDVHQLLGIQIYNPSFQPVHFIAAEDIVHVDLGTYTAIVPGSVLNQVGDFRDEWGIIGEPGGPQVFRSFQINVVAILQQPQGFSASFIECSIADLDACMLKKNYLWPVWSALSNGYYLSDQQLQYAIDVGLSFVERKIGMPLRQVRVLTRPYSDEQTPVNPTKGVDYDEDGSLIQWSVIESSQWSGVRLPRSNIIRIRGIRGVYGGNVVYRIPTEWVDRNELSMGFIRVRPTTTGSIAGLIDNSGRFLDVTLLEAIGASFVPGFWAVDYDYGFENSVIPKEICDVVMKKAAITILDQLGMSITRGLGSRSASVDGLSTSIGYLASADRTMFGGLVARYEQDLSEQNLMDLRKFYKGPSAFFF